MAQKSRIRTKKDVTLRDVVMHMYGMEERLTSKIEGVDSRLSSKIDAVEKSLSSKIHENTIAIHDLRLRIDAVEEDLTATIKDTVKIRRHVGMTSSQG